MRLDHLLSKEKEKVLKGLLFIFQCTLQDVRNEMWDVRTSDILTSKLYIDLKKSETHKGKDLDRKL